MIKEKLKKTFGMGNWFLHHDTVRSHTAFIIKEFLAKEKNQTVVLHPPYSPDLAPSDVFLFPSMKIILRVEDLTELRTFK